MGKVVFTQVDKDTVFVEYEVFGLTPGNHGFHVHEKADFSNGCVSAGPHYNPFGKLHAGREDADRHAGDLGNIEADASGRAKGGFVDSVLRLEGEHSVIGRSIMVHADPDDDDDGLRRDEEMGRARSSS